MTEKYVVVYSILFDVDKLSKDEYEQLIITYGKTVVDSVIEDLIGENEENFSRFEVYYSEKVQDLDKITDMKNFDIYCSDVKSFSVFDAEKNLEIMKKIYGIIREIEELFSLFNFDDLKILGVKVPWITDKINYCISKCDDVELLSKLKFLNNQYNKYRDIIIESNLKLVISIALQYGSVIDSNFDDIVQDGNIGLMRAVEKFNPYMGSAFSTYAYHWIEQHIIRGIKKTKYSVKIPEDVVYDNHRLLGVQNDLCLELGREVTNKELASYTGNSLDEIKLWSKLFLEPLSLNEVLEFASDDTTGLEITRCGLVVDESADVFEKVVMNDSLMRILNLLRTYLDDRELMIIKYHLGLGVADYRLNEIAKMLKISPQRVGQIKRDVVKRLSRKHKLRALVRS